MNCRHSISKKQTDRIIEVANKFTFNEAYKILGIKKSSLKKRLREIERKYNIKVSFKEDTSKPQLPKVLIFDIETTPIRVFVWGLFGNKYINHDNIITDWNILSWSAKWLFGDEIFGEVLTSREATNGDDSRIIKSIWDKFNEADIVIAHNGNRFDIPRLNTRFILNNLNPPNSYKSIDTLAVVKKHFKFTSNRLDYLGKLISNKQKIETNFQLWKDCLDGDKKALSDMLTYNFMDVELLEEVYLELRPWIKSHPNMGLYLDADTKHGAFACSNCGKTHDPASVKWDGVYSTTVSQFRTFRCDCGALIRTRNSHKIATLVSPAN